ncbi:hypothetical protein BCV69DRAFT_300319 [Microstroma glucosiphilum]|uniref:Uncharacterized protein n=1 Tax=Pseudomicrostroma glucosiphilum TaxID=1684307 RepID=A0A316U3X4_9BASI|nr:hypothetical protein BCV69DRAFT_300319 [Pseudomicrostroma glucosiphilum]PWN19494.1 hypothetical protein BCV69DRAFT_300319 [Pseudomicrostroma glucosiphilum]
MAFPTTLQHQDAISSFANSPDVPKDTEASQVGIVWADYQLAEQQQRQGSEPSFSDSPSSTEGSQSEGGGSESDTDDEGSVRRRPLSGVSEYATFIPQSLSLPQGLGIHDDDGGDLSEPDDPPSVSTSRRGSVTGRNGPSNRIASTTFMRESSSAPSLGEGASSSRQHIPRSAPAFSRQHAAMAAAIQEWHVRQASATTGFDSDDTEESEPESIKDNEMVKPSRRGSKVGHTAINIELEQDSSDEEGSASSHSSNESVQQTAERSAASSRLFAALSNRGKNETSQSDDRQPRSPTRSASGRMKALSHRRGHRTLPSLQQIQSRVAEAAGSSTNAQTRPPLRTGVSSPGPVTHHTPAPGQARVTSCPTPSLSGKWWQFGQVSVMITPPTPGQQPPSPLMGYILQNAGNPVHAVKFRRTRDDLDMLAPPPFELAPGRQQMMEERDRERAATQALIKQSQEQVMAAFAAMRLAAEREGNMMGRRGSASNGSGKVIGMGWPGSPGTPLPPNAAAGLGGPGVGTMPMRGMAMPPPSSVPRSAPATVNMTPSRLVDFAPHGLPRRPTPQSAGPTMPSRRNLKSPPPPPPTAPLPVASDAGKYVPPGRRNSRRIPPPSSLPRRPSVEGSAVSVPPSTGERSSAGQNMLSRLGRRRVEAC